MNNILRYEFSIKNLGVRVCIAKDESWIRVSLRHESFEKSPSFEKYFNENKPIDYDSLSKEITDFIKSVVWAN